MKYSASSLAVSLGLACASTNLKERASTVQGFDISHYQASVDFQAAYNSGARFVIVKATEAPSGSSHGAYHFARPASSSGTVQANFFLANGGEWVADGMTLPGMVDLEDNTSGAQCYGLSQSDMVAWIVDFVDTYSGTTGRFPMIYTTNNWWSACTGNYNGFASSCPLVLARYAASPGAVPGDWTSYTIWQNSDRYTYGGDSDIFNGDETALLDLASGTSLGRSAQLPASGLTAQEALVDNTSHAACS